MLRSELYRAFHRKGPYLAFLLGVVAVVGGYASTEFGQIVFAYRGGATNQFNVWYIFLQTIGDNWNSPWGFVLPLLVVLPFGDTLIYDLNHGFEVPLMLRVGMKRYFVSKWFANAFAVVVVFGAVIVAALIIAIVWRHDFQMPHRLALANSFVKGVFVTNKKGLAIDKSMHWNGVFVSSYAPHVLRNMFWKDIGLFTVLTALISLLSAVCISSLSLVASLWVRNRYLVLSAPFIMYMFFIVAPQYVVPSLFMWAPHIMADAFWQFPRSVWSIACYWIIPLLVTLGLMSLGARRYRNLGLLVMDHKE
ncbi:MAG: hypothetical protein ACYCVB_17280 [Bacilli bacterium]